MTNFFAGIHRASDSMNTARYGLEVTGQNIANADTPGYTRQASRQASVGASTGVPTLHSGVVDNGGVRVAGTDRLTDPVLDNRLRSEHGRGALADTGAARIGDIENIFAEPRDNGLAEQLHDFWNAWGDVANDPGNSVPREMLIQQGVSVTTSLHAMDGSLDNVADMTTESLDTQISQANSALAELKDLNTHIAIAQQTGSNPNSLLDRRDQLLDTLSTTVGGTGTLNSNGTVDKVTVGGQDIDLATLTGTAITTSGSSPSLVLQVGGTAASPLGASTAAADLTTLNTTIPDYRGKLDAVAQALAGKVNTLQGSGFDLGGTAGAAMFDDGGATPSGITAANISIASGFTANKVAAAGSDGGSPPASVGALDASNALAGADLGHAADGPDSKYSDLVGDLGRASAAAQQQQSTQDSITSSVQSMKDSVSGVSFDEEMSNMLTYQHAYQASARVLTTLDSMLDTLINRTGMVGR